MNGQPPRALCCWPGLARLWLYGHWSSLLAAVGFSVLLNLALVSTFLWPALFGPRFSAVLWPVVIVFWLTGVCLAWRTVRQAGQAPQTTGKTDDTLFIQAQTEYLMGDWTQAELLLTQRLQHCPRDAESRLLLATLFRRNGRQDKARQQLKTLARLDDAHLWQFEIAREWQFIDDDQTAGNGRIRSEMDASTDVDAGETTQVSDTAVDTDRQDLQIDLTVQTIQQRAA
ncbi:MAG: tetratricopeptide repeat protein [Pirellulaceae bacterium]